MGIAKSFEKLRRFEGLILNARSIVSQSDDGNCLLSVTQSRGHWIVWQKKQQQNADCNSDKAKDEEHDLPQVKS